MKQISVNRRMKTILTDEWLPEYLNCTFSLTLKSVLQSVLLMNFLCRCKKAHLHPHKGLQTYSLPSRINHRHELRPSAYCPSLATQSQPFKGVIRYKTHCYILFEHKCVSSVCTQPPYKDKNPPSGIFLVSTNNKPLFKSSHSQLLVCVTSHTPRLLP